MKPYVPTGTAGPGILIAFFSLLCTAPTPGDVGGCGQEPAELDPPIFFGTKKTIDCDRCSECSLVSRLCDEACDEGVAPKTGFPEGCVPLVHDGEVCLRALLAASCSDYRTYISDRSPETPSECGFCPARRE